MIILSFKVYRTYRSEQTREGILWAAKRHALKGGMAGEGKWLEYKLIKQCQYYFYQKMWILKYQHAQ